MNAKHEHVRDVIDKLGSRLDEAIERIAILEQWRDEHTTELHDDCDIKTAEFEGRTKYTKDYRG